MNEKEKARRLVRDAVTALLVAIEQPRSEDDALALLEDWEATPYEQLLVAKDYNLQRAPWVNSALLNHVNLCLTRAERVLAGKKKEA